MRRMCLLLELCVIVGLVVCVAGAFLCAGRGNRQVLRLKYNPKRSKGVEISVVTRQGLNLNVHSHRTTFAPSTRMSTPIINQPINKLVCWYITILINLFVNCLSSQQTDLSINKFVGISIDWLIYHSFSKSVNQSTMSNPNKYTRCTLCVYCVEFTEYIFSE